MVSIELATDWRSGAVNPGICHTIEENPAKPQSGIVHGHPKSVKYRSLETDQIVFETDAACERHWFIKTLQIVFKVWKVFEGTNVLLLFYSRFRRSEIIFITVLNMNKLKLKK